MSERKIECVCSYCGKTFYKAVGEYNRCMRLGRKFYCGAKCAGKGVNEVKKKPDIVKICPVCGKSFTTTTKAKGATFCSRSCASKGSVTPARTEAGKKAVEASFKVRPPMQAINELMKKREAWKYVEVDNYLNSINEKHEFEYRDGNYIYDLALLNRKIIIEFDGSEHRSVFMARPDLLKEDYINQKGFIVYRIYVKPNSVIPIDGVAKILKYNKI